MRPYEPKDNRLKLIINIIILIISLYSVSISSFSAKKISVFNQLMVDTIAPIQESVFSVRGKLASIWTNYLMNVSAQEDNKNLKGKINELKGEIFVFQELVKENKRLKNLLEFELEAQSKKVLAKVVAWDASSDFKVIRINKGKKDGIKLKATVITSEGLVGYIYRLSKNYSDVLTIIDSNNRVDALVERTRSHGVLEGYKDSLCLMKYVTRTEPLILDDTVITSGLGSLYPKGVKVGNITKIQRESYGITQYVEIMPSVDFGKLEEVVVLISIENQKIINEWSQLDLQKK